MEYNEHKPIYLQIGDRICENILSGEWKDNGRIPSVREMAGIMGVNPNTVARSFEYLEGDGILFNRRGIGYFVSPGAAETIRQRIKERFFAEELPVLRKKMEMLGITPAELATRLDSQEK